MELRKVLGSGTVSRDLCDRCEAVREFSLVTAIRVVGRGARGSAGNRAGMSRAGGREGRTAVGEVPWGACAVGRVVGELPLRPAALAVGLA